MAYKQKRDLREVEAVVRGAVRQVLDDILKDGNTPENEEELVGKVALRRNSIWLPLKSTRSCGCTHSAR